MVSAALDAAPLLPGLMAGLVAGPVVHPPPQRRPRAGPPGMGQAPPAGVLLLWTLAAGLATIGSNSAASYFIQIGTHSGRRPRSPD